MVSGEYELIILDEILGAVSQGQIDLEQLVDLIQSRPRRQNLLLTGPRRQGAFHLRS